MILTTSQFQFFDFFPLGDKSCDGNVHRLREVFDGIGRQNCTGTFGILKSSNCRAIAAIRASKTSHAIPSRLSQYLGCLLRVATRLIAEAAAISVDLKAALHDDRPADQDVVRHRHRAVTLIGAKVSELSAERAAPHDGVPAIARMTEIYCVLHVRYVATNQIGVSSKPTASEDQRFASDPFLRAVRARDLHSDNASLPHPPWVCSAMLRSE